MSCVLAVDVGNTTARFGLLRVAEAAEPELVASCEVTTRQPLTADEACIQLGQILAELGGGQHADAAPHANSTARGGGSACTENAPGSAYVSEGNALAGSILSCVVPTLTDVWHRALDAVVPGRQLVVGPGLRSGIKLRFNDPSEVGPDRIADAVAARATYGEPAVVIDLGTTTNFEAIDAAGAFCGGVIAPGITIGAQALTKAAARLPIIELRTPDHVLGRSTREAMQSGIVLGEAARIDGLLDIILHELVGNSAHTDAPGAAQANVPTGDTGAGARDAKVAARTADVPIVITGENAAAIAVLLRHRVTVDDTLTLRGLALIWQNNQRRAGTGAGK